MNNRSKVSNKIYLFIPLLEEEIASLNGRQKDDKITSRRIYSVFQVAMNPTPQLVYSRTDAESCVLIFFSVSYTVHDYNTLVLKLYILRIVVVPIEKI